MLRPASQARGLARPPAGERRCTSTGRRLPAPGLARAAATGVVLPR
jgi:hypothetical protein